MCCKPQSSYTDLCRANIGGAAVSHQQLHAAIALLGPDLEPTKFAYATEEGETTNREAEPKGFCSALGSCLFCLLCPWCWASRSQHPNHRSSGNVVREIEHELQYVTARGLDHFEHHGPVVKSVESELKEIEMELGASASRRIKTLAKNMSGAKLNDKKATRKAQDLIDEWSKGEAWLV
jgi:hypothetical protein